jgi:hypothetical protein
MQIVVKDTLTNPIVINHLKFEQKKLNEVFQLLQTYYGVEIVGESSTIYNCVFTGDVSGQDLFCHVMLEKGERSELANLANQLL